MQCVGPSTLREDAYMANPVAREFERQRLLAVHGHDGDEVGHPGPSMCQAFKDVGRTGRIVR